MKKLFIIILFFMVVQLIAGESRFGLVENSPGKIKNTYGAAGIGRGFEVASDDSLQINFRNFSTATTLTKTTLTLNTGYNAIWGDNSISKNYIDDAGFNGGYLSVPLMEKKMSMVASILPYTALEQRIANSRQFNDQPVTENIVVRGGLARANINIAYAVNDWMSVAAGYEFTFGRVTEEAIISIDDDLNSEIELAYENQYAGQSAILSAFFKPTDKLNVGLVVRPPVIGTFTRMGETGAALLDEETEMDLTLPAEYNAGIIYALGSNYLAGADIIYQNWKSGYKLDDETQAGFQDYYRFSLGLERKASSRRFVKYVEQIDYRAGLFYGKLAQTYNNEIVNEYGISIGMSLPVERFRSKIDLSVLVGRRGDAASIGLEETFVGVGLSISANEQWFVNIED